MLYKSQALFYIYFNWKEIHSPNLTPEIVYIQFMWLLAWKMCSETFGDFVWEQEITKLQQNIIFDVIFFLDVIGYLKPSNLVISRFDKNI